MSKYDKLKCWKTEKAIQIRVTNKKKWKSWSQAKAVITFRPISRHIKEEGQNICRHTVPMLKWYAAKTIKFQKFHLQSEGHENFTTSVPFFNLHTYTQICGSNCNRFGVAAKQRNLKRLALKMYVKAISHLAEFRRLNVPCRLANACQKLHFCVQPFGCNYKKTLTFWQFDHENEGQGHWLFVCSPTTLSLLWICKRRPENSSRCYRVITKQWHF